ncbi:MAG: S1/P1 nuclease [Pirellulales bacterium]
MRAWGLAAACWLLLTAPALGWNEKGHMAVARLAWLKLSACQRAACTEILQQHPHYQEYLAADKPEGVSVDEWAFLRAAYWPDWIRSNHEELFSRPTWHYVTQFYVPPYSKLDASALPSHQAPNVVTQITANGEKLRCGNGPDRAVALCWLIHLVGDIHQPLHCCSLLSETFPEGDRGGNLGIVRLDGGMPVVLHAAWDNMLGDELGLAPMLAEVQQIASLESAEAESISRDVQSHRTPTDWAQEGFAAAQKYAYLNGDLRPCHVDQQADVQLIPNLSSSYVQSAKAVARRSAATAARRLALGISSSLAR